MTTTYELQGRMAEVCTCHTFCPCVAGLDPDGNVCEFSWVFHFDRGEVTGIDVSGLNLGIIGRLEGGVNSGGSVRAAVYVDDRSTREQQEAILAAFTGQLGGPLADLASLISEVAVVERADIEFDVECGTGRFRTGSVFAGEIEAHRGPSGQPTSITDFALAPLGHRVYAGRPTAYRMDAADIGFEFEPNSASQFEFHHLVR